MICSFTDHSVKDQLTIVNLPDDYRVELIERTAG